MLSRFGRILSGRDVGPLLGSVASSRAMLVLGLGSRLELDQELG